MWHNKFDSESFGPRGMYFYEPLPTSAPEDSQPYCCLIRTVIFYKKPWPGNLEQIDEIESQWDLLGQRFSDEVEGWTGVAPFVWHNEQLYELGGGEVIWRNGQWCKKWTAWRVSPDDRRRPFIRQSAAEAVLA